MAGTTPPPSIPQSAPVTSGDLSVNSGLIDARPLQAPLPPVNIPGYDQGNNGTGTSGKMSIGELFSSMKTPSDEKQYANPDYTPQPLTKRYSNWNPNVDNEEVAAQKQPWYDKWANGLVKMGATAIGTFAQSLMTIPDSAKALSSGKISDLYQSPLENSVDTWQKNLEDEFPNYYTKLEQAHPFLSALPFSGGFANFWSDKVVKNLGFTIGAIGGAALQDVAVGALTEGIGEIPLVGAQLGKAALWLNKIFSNETKLGEFLGASKPGLLSTLTKGAEEVSASSKAILDMTDLARMAGYKKVTDAGRFAVNLYGAARTEAGFEARDGFNQVKQDLTAQFQKDNFRDPTSDETAEIEKYATAGANVRFGANMALLTLSDAIQFDNILKPFSAAKHGITSSLQKSLENEGEEIGLKEGTTDVFEVKKPTTASGKIWNIVKPQIPNILSEGVYEEGGQYAAQVATQNYYERKYFQDKDGQQEGTDKTPWSPSFALNAMHSVGEGLSSEFGTTDGWENIILGGVTAVLTGGFEHYWDKFHGDEKNKSTQATLAVLNNNSVTGLLQNMYGNATKSGFAMQQMQNAVKTGDLFSYKNNQSDMFTNFVLAHLQANRFNVAMEKLNFAKEMPQAEFEKAFGISDSPEAKKTASQYIDALKERAESIKNNYDAINEVFQNPHKFDAHAKTKEELQENDNHNKFEEWKYTLLEHSSNIDDTNRRLSQIASKVNGVNPAVTRPLLERLTHPGQLQKIAKDYEDKAADLKSMLEQKLSGDRKGDKKQLAAYENNAELIKEYLSVTPNGDDKQFLKMFDSVLHFEMNGQTVDTSNPIELRKQVLPSLIKYGVDSNKLQARKEIASKAYDILTSEAGFSHYFAALKKRESNSATVADSLPPGPIDVDTENMTPPTKVAGGKEVTFKEGQVYPLNIGTKKEANIQNLTYQGVDSQGNPQFMNPEGKTLTIPANKIRTIEDKVKKISDSFISQTQKVGIGDPVISDVIPKEEDRKKDISFAPLSTTDPLYSDKTPFNNFHQRHQQFLFNLGSTDPKVFNQEVKPNLRIVPVTAKTADLLGFPEEFTKASQGEESIIRAVYISVEGDKAYTVDHNGKKVSEFGKEKTDPNKIIFTTLPNTDLRWQGQDRYTNKSNLNEKVIQQKHKEFREALLNQQASQVQPFNFQVSRGIPNIINQNSRNSVVDVGLVRKEDLTKVVITIPTQGNTAIAALLNDEGKGVSSSVTGVNMPLGIPLLNHGGNLIYLNNRKLTDKEAINAHELLVELASRAFKNKKEGEDVLDQTILKYLSRVLYFSAPQEGKQISNNQMWIDKTGFHIGEQFNIPFVPNLIESNKDKITTILKDIFHNVNNFELNRVAKENAEDLKFNTIAVKDGKIQSTGEYSSYAEYLLNSDNPPLATNIAKPVGNEPPLIGKYSVLQSSTFQPTLYQSTEAKPKPSLPAIPSAVKKPATTKTTKRNIYWSRHSRDTEDADKLTGGNEATSLTESGKKAAKDFAAALIDRGVTSIIVSPTNRAKETAYIITQLLGIPVKISDKLKSWDIGEWAGASDQDFNRAEKYFVEHPTEKTFEGKSLNEDFQSYVGRVVVEGSRIETSEPEGSLVLTHSKNLAVWNAYNKSNKTWDEAARKAYFDDEKTPNAALTQKSQKALDNSTKTNLLDVGNGKKLKYTEIFDSKGNLIDIKVLAGVRADGTETKFSEADAAIHENTIKTALGLISPTPQITSPITNELNKEDNRLKYANLLKEVNNLRQNGANMKVSEIEAIGKKILDDPKIKDLVSDKSIFKSKNDKASDAYAVASAVIDGTNNLQEAIEQLAKSETAPKNALDKLKQQKGKPTDTQYSAAYVIPQSYTPANIQEEFAKAKEMVPDSVQFHTLNDLIHMTGGGKAWGAMRDAAIYVYKDAIQGTTYHEAFELIWGNFLKSGQQLALYTEFKGREGTFIDYTGKETKFSEANFKQAKEQIADEFRDYTLGNKVDFQTKQKNWFERLTDFIKSIFMGPQSSINQLFKNISQGYYKNYPASQKSINSIEYSNIKASAAFVQDVLQGMTAQFFSEQFEKDSAIVTQLEENPKQTVGKIYGGLFNSLQHFFDSDDDNATDTLAAIYGDKVNNAKTDGEAQQAAQEFDGIQKHWDFIKANWSEFVKEHMKYLRVFKIEFNVDDNGDVSMDSSARRDLENPEKMVGGSEYARDVMTTSARNSASELVKLTLATIADREFLKKSFGAAAEGVDKTRIKRENSQVRLPKLAPYAKFFNYLLHNVTNINGIYDIHKKLVDMSNNVRIKSNAIVDALVKRMGFDHGFKDKNLDTMKSLLSIENALNKQKPNFVRQFVDDNGNVYFKTSIINSKVDQTVDNWIAQMKASGAVKVSKANQMTFDKDISGVKHPIDMLQSLGIQIDKEDYDNLGAGDKTKFNAESEKVRSLMMDNRGKEMPIFTTKQLGVDSRLISLASIYVDKMVGDDTDSMHFNLDGELTANFVLPNYVSTVLNDANNSKTKEEFIAKNPQFNDIFHRDSTLLNEILYGEDGKFRKPVEVTVIEGREAADTNNKSSYSLTEAERYIQEINNNLQGVFYTLLPADAKTEWGVYTGQYIKASEYFNEVTNQQSKNKFFNKMWNNLLTEISLAQDFRTNPNRKNITELNKKYGSRKKGDSLRFFSDILSPETVASIHSQVIDGDTKLEDVISKGDFNTFMQGWITDKADKSFKYLSDERIFGYSDRGNLKANGLLSDFLSNHIGKGEYHSKENITNLLAYREMNYALNGIEMHKFFFGDPAQYSDEMKRIKSFLSGREYAHVDTLETAEGFNQAANSLLNKASGVPLKESDPGFHKFSNSMNTITLHDIIVMSSYYEMLAKKENLGPKEAKAYKEMNEADAQSLQIATSYREALLKSGGMRWSQAMENQFQWEMAYERNAKSNKGIYTYSSESLRSADNKLLQNRPDSKVYFYITKPIHSGIQVVGNIAIMSLDKTSAAPLFYRFVEGTQLEDLYNAMQKKGTDYVRVESAHKVGIQQDSNISLYDSNGAVNIQGINGATHESVPFRYWGIQVDTSAKHESQTEGSQLRSQATGDLLDDEVPLDFSQDSKLSKEAAKSAWDKLEESEKEKISPIYKLVRTHDRDLKALTQNRYNSLLNKLGATEHEDGTFTYKDVTKVADFISKEITRRELPNNLRDAIGVNPDDSTQFKVPLESLVNYQAVRSILWSTIEKNVIRPKVSGGMKVQLAATGWEKAHRVVISEVNGKQVYTSSELKFYGKDENGNTTKAEIYLPYWFGDKVKASLEKNGKTFKSDKEFTDHLLNYLNNTEIGKKLLSGIGFRIPTQRDNSIESFIVKDFLPEQMGDTIVFPSEITAKAGSDFDIDKMNTYLRNFFINDKGYPEAIPFKNIDSSKPEELKDYYEKYIAPKRAEYEAYTKGKENPESTLEADNEDDEVDYVPTLGEYVEQAKGKTAYEFNSLEALENKYFDTLEQIYSLPQKFRGLVSPNDASDLKAISQKIAKMRDPNFNETKQPYGRAIDSLWMMQERHKYLVGKKGVGIAAVSQKNLSVNQTSGVYLKLPKDTKIRLPFNSVRVGEHTYVSLGSLANQSGEMLSRVNAMYIDGYVDIAKGAWIIDLGANDELAKNFLLMSKWGTDPYDVALFMNQPSIQMYTKEMSSRKSVSQINKDIQVFNAKRMYDEVHSKFKPGISKYLLQKDMPEGNYSTSDMERMITKYGKDEELTKDEAKLQMQMLLDYQKYDSLAWDMFRFFQGYNWDTARFGDPNLVRKKLLLEKNAKKGSISSIGDVFSKTFIGATRDAAIKSDNALRSLVSLQVGDAGTVLDRTAEDLSKRRGLTQDDFRKVMLKAELSMLDYTTQTGVSIGGKEFNKLISPLLLSNTSAARYLDAIQKSGDLNLVNNPMIKNLRANIDVREGFPSSIELIEKDNDSYTSNVWTDALRELSNDATVISIDDNPANDRSVAQIYRMMMLSSLLQSGTKRSSTSWTHLIPNEHYSAFVKDALQNIKSDMDNFYNKNIFYRTNWEDNNVVPVVPKTTLRIPDGSGGILNAKVYQSFNSRKVTEHFENQGIENPPLILRLNHFEWKDKKVVKTVDYTRDPKTRQIIEKNVRLFQRVDTYDKDGNIVPLQGILTEKFNFGTGEFERVPSEYVRQMDDDVQKTTYAVFKEINKWGAGTKVQEYYQNQIKSELSTNPFIEELDDDEIAYTILNDGYEINGDVSGNMSAPPLEDAVQGDGPADTQDVVDDVSPDQEFPNPTEGDIDDGINQCNI